MTDISFEGRVAVITGAGGGLGRQHALLLASRGAQVVVNDLGGALDGTGTSQGPAEEVAAEITELGGVAVPDANNIATPQGGEALIQTALDAFGRVDIVINNAGILRDKSFANMDPTLWDPVIQVHLSGAICVTRPAWAYMRDQGYGRVINTASGSGLFGNYGQANYGAAKMGLVGLSHVLAIEGARYGITSNVIAPAARSRLTGEILGPLAEAFDPELVMPLALYLVSADCDLTHEIFSVGGGHYARVFLGESPGWFAGQARPSVEDVRDHLGEIRAEDGYVVPASVTEELRVLTKLLT